MLISLFPIFVPNTVVLTLHVTGTKADDEDDEDMEDKIKECEELNEEAQIPLVDLLAKYKQKCEKSDLPPFVFFILSQILVENTVACMLL